MFKLDNNFLIELGLGALPADEKNKMLAHIYETLEMRVGMKLAEQMTDAQLDEFESYINRNDEAGALKWLETNFPGYKDVVAAELEKLKSEVRQVAPQIVAESMNSANAASAVVPPAPTVDALQQPAYQQMQPQAPTAQVPSGAPVYQPATGGYAPAAQQQVYAPDPQSMQPQANLYQPPVAANPPQPATGQYIPGPPTASVSPTPTAPVNAYQPPMINQTQAPAPPAPQLEPYQPPAATGFSDNGGASSATNDPMQPPYQPPAN